MIYGKHFASMYKGSMVGAGAHVFAVMGYVIANQQPDKEFGGVVELNVDILAAILGEPVDRIQSAIDYLCAPDLKTRTDGNDGRRLIRVGQFAYKVVNYKVYFAIKNTEDQAEANRRRQAEFRARAKAKKEAKNAWKKASYNPPPPGEEKFIQAMEAGAPQETLDKIVTDNLPGEYQ